MRSHMWDVLTVADSDPLDLRTKGVSPFCLREDKGPENPSVWLTNLKVISS